MKKLIFPILALLAILSSTSAQAPAARELGVRFEGINLGGQNNFSLVYKKQKAEDRYVRWRAVFGNISANNLDVDPYNVRFGFGGNLGLEKRKALADRFSFVRGPEFGLNISLAFGEDDPLVAMGAQLGYVLGLQYNAGKHFFFNLETIPGVGLSINSEAPGDDQTAVFGNIGFNSFAALTAGFRF